MIDDLRNFQFRSLRLAAVAVAIILTGCSLLNEARVDDSSPTGGPEISISIVSFRDGGGPPAPGNTPAYDIWLENTGGATACGVEASIVGQEYSVLYDCIQPGQASKGYMNDYFHVSIPDDATSGDSLDFSLSISDEDGNHWDDQFSIEVQ